MRVRCRSCGATQHLQIIDEGLFVPEFHNVYDGIGRLRYRTFAHRHDRCPALARIDAVAREYEQRIAQNRVH